MSIRNNVKDEDLIGIVLNLDEQMKAGMGLGGRAVVFPNGELLSDNNFLWHLWKTIPL